MGDTGGGQPELQNTHSETSGGGTSAGEQSEAMETVAETSEEAEAGGSDSEETLDISASHPADSFDMPYSLVLSDVPIKYSFDHPYGLLKEIKEASTAQSKLELSPTSVTQSVLSLPSPTPGQQRLSSPQENTASTCMQAVEYNQKSSCPRLFYSKPTLNIPPPDGYNWRKYGQKQVKSPQQGSRSYYRCTYSDCHAKKIEYSDQMHRVTDTVYRSIHNHELPQKVNTPRETKRTFSPSPLSHDCKLAHLNTSSVQDPKPISEFKEQESTRLNVDSATNDKVEDGNTAKNKRLKGKSSPNISESLPNPEKKAKMVVHADGDVGISSDGYRWRKYGQKMVKGNPYPRNYYRCTSAGCPVRKHIERAVGNTGTLIITYKDMHDHDMPVPKKPVDPPSSFPLVPTTTAMTTHCPGEKLELEEGEQTSNSAKALVSIEFEIKPC